MPGRHLGGWNSTPAPLTAVTDAAGVASFVIPPGRLRRYAGAMATVVAPTSTGLFACQVTAAPSTTADLPTGATAADVTARTVQVQVAKSNTITTLLLGSGMGLVPAQAGVTVHLLPLGI